MSCNNSGAVDPHILSPALYLLLPPQYSVLCLLLDPFPCSVIIYFLSVLHKYLLLYGLCIVRPRILRPPFFAIIIIICHILIFNRIVTFNLHRLLACLLCFLVHTFDSRGIVSLSILCWLLLQRGPLSAAVVFWFPPPSSTSWHLVGVF